MSYGRKRAKNGQKRRNFSFPVKLHTGHLTTFPGPMFVAEHSRVDFERKNARKLRRTPADMVGEFVESGTQIRHVSPTLYMQTTHSPSFVWLSQWFPHTMSLLHSSSTTPCGWKPRTRFAPPNRRRLPGYAYLLATCFHLRG